MRELSLFTGAGGGLLASKLLGWRTIGCVEWNPFRQAILAQRMRDGVLDECPIFGDIRSFIGDGYAERYRGVADVVSAGFPCRPFSHSGQRRGADDPRNQWPATAECIRIVRPRFAFLENVPALLTSGYFDTIVGHLADCGYDARWECISAAAIGGPIRRERLWIVAESNAGDGTPRLGSQQDWPSPLFARSRAACSERWLQAVSGVARGADGVADYLDRVEAIGDGQVPAVAALAWRVLTEGGRG